MRKPVVDYRGFRLSRLREPQFYHLNYLWGWVGYFLLYFLTENLIPRENCTVIHSRLDDLIPFCEWFIFAYMSWHVSLVWMSLYTLAYDIPAFKRFMWYLILTTILAEIVYVIWPNQQLLRPDLTTLGRDNLLTKAVGIIYTVDTNTNVCPSLHCIGGFAVLFAALDMPRFRTKGWTVFFVIFALLICASTVFMKQHSIVDFFAAIPVILIGWLAIYLPAILKAHKAK